MKAEEGTLYAYDMDSDTELATFNQDFVLTSLFQTGADGLISSTSGEDTSYFCFNPHGDASLLTDEEGNTTSQLHYDAWGNAAEETDEPFAWLGKHQRRTLPDLGLIKMGARFYDPETGRFISRDPVEGHDEVPISRNRYVYAYDDPVNKTDLSGEDPYSDDLRAEARRLQYLGNELEQQGLHEQAQDNWNNARRLFELANEHDSVCIENTQRDQGETNPQKCNHPKYLPNRDKRYSWFHDVVGDKPPGVHYGYGFCSEVLKSPEATRLRWSADIHVDAGSGWFLDTWTNSSASFTCNPGTNWELTFAISELQLILSEESQPFRIAPNISAQNRSSTHKAVWHREDTTTFKKTPVFDPNRGLLTMMIDGPGRHDHYPFYMK